ncbi:MAG: hypothetical protein WBS54_01085 [Acidobacteriota bacterium]
MIGVFAMAAVLAAMVLLMVGALRRTRGTYEARAQRAAERGWVYGRGEGSTAAYSVEGRVGSVAWRLEAGRSGRGAGGARWVAKELGSGGAVVEVMDRRGAALIKSPWLHKVAEWMVPFLPANDQGVESFRALMERSVEVETGDPLFDAAYAVLATDAGPARTLLDAGVRQAMVGWAGKRQPGSGGRSLSVTWSLEGLSLSWPGTLADPEAMARFIEIGQLLGRAAQGRF